MKNEAEIRKLIAFARGYSPDYPYDARHHDPLHEAIYAVGETLLGTTAACDSMRADLYSIVSQYRLLHAALVTINFQNAEDKRVVEAVLKRLNETIDRCTGN